MSGAQQSCRDGFEQGLPVKNGSLGYAQESVHLIDLFGSFLVAGEGFEPSTFGL